MAEDKSSSVQNRLGQLFIDFGTKGFSPLQQQLKMIKGNFNLATMAAKGLTDFLIKGSKSGSEYVTQLEKIKAVTGLKFGFLQDLERFSKLNNVDFSSLVNQLENLQQKVVKLKITGKAEGLEGFTLLGLNPRDFDSKDPMAMLEAIRKRVQNLDEATAAGALEMLGLDKQLLYAWKQQNKGFAERLRLNDKQVESLKEQQTAWNNLADAWETGQRNFISNQTWINKLLNEAAYSVAQLFLGFSDLGKAWNDNSSSGKEESMFFSGLANMGKKIGKWKQDRKDIVLSEKGLDQESVVRRQLQAAYDAGDKDVFKRYEEARKRNDEEEIKLIQEIDKKLEETNSELKEANNKDKGNVNNFPLITDLINAQILNGKNLPTIKDIPENIPQASVITNNSTSGSTFAVTINQTITGQDADLIARSSSGQISTELNSIFNQNLANT